MHVVVAVDAEVNIPSRAGGVTICGSVYVICIHLCSSMAHLWCLYSSCLLPLEFFVS